MKHVNYLTVIMVAAATGALCHADPFAYIERWASGTLTTGEEFESWRIHVVVPDGQDWVGSSIDGWLSGGPTWYLVWPPGEGAGGPPDPNLFPSDPDAEFMYYYTSPHFYPNSDELGQVGTTCDDVYEPTHVHLGGWFDLTFDTDGDYVVWQGTVLNPLPEVYGRIEFGYGTRPEPFVEDVTFLIPEPGSAALLALCACCLLRRR